MAKWSNCKIRNKTAPFLLRKEKQDRTGRRPTIVFLNPPSGKVQRWFPAIRPKGLRQVSRSACELDVRSETSRHPSRAVMEFKLAIANADVETQAIRDHDQASVCHRLFIVLCHSKPVFLMNYRDRATNHS